MRNTRWGCGAVLLISLAWGAAMARPPRTDINPAVLYLHAFGLFPVLEDAESQMLGSSLNGEISGEQRELARLFDSAFHHILRARTCTAPADWGTDVADGPNAITPNLRKVRMAAQAGVLRARIALADADQERARDELLAVSVLSRHSAAGTSLVGTMVQVAAETMILDFVGTHFEQLSAKTRAEITAGLRASPRRATVADAMLQEKAGFCDWLVAKIEAVRTKGGKDEAALQEFRTTIAATFENDSDLAGRIIEASGGTSTGVVRYIKSVDHYYQRSNAIARAPAQDLKRITSEYEAEVNAATNLLARVVLPNVSRARVKELDFEARLGRLPNAAP